MIIAVKDDSALCISLFNPEEQLAVKNFILDCLSEFGFGYIQQYDFDLDDPQKIYVETGGKFYVLKNRSEIIGTIAIKNHDHAVAEIKRLYVDQKYQGQGLGQWLLDILLKYCQENNFKKVILDSPKQFTVSHNLYKKNGFTLTAEDHRVFYMEKLL